MRQDGLRGTWLGAVSFLVSDINQLLAADLISTHTWDGNAHLPVMLCQFNPQDGWLGVRPAPDGHFGQHCAQHGAAETPSLIRDQRIGPGQSVLSTNLKFGKRCADLHMRPSLGTLGDAYNNTMADSFFASL